MALKARRREGRMRRITIVTLLGFLLAACSGSSEVTDPPTPGGTASSPSVSPSPTETEPSNEPTIAATIEVAAAPVNPSFGFGSVWVPNHHAALVTRIDPETNEVLAEIPVGELPGGNGLEAFGSMWFPNYGESTVSRVDPATNTATSIDTGNGLTCGDPVEAGGLVWVGNCDALVLTGIDPETSTVARTLEVEGFPFGNGKQLWVDQAVDLAQIDPRTGQVLTTVDAGSSEHASAASFEGDRFWVSYGTGGMGLVGAVAVVDLRTGDVTELGTVGSNPAAPVVDGGSVFVYNGEDRTISIVDAASGEISEPVPIPDFETEAISVGFGSVWVADFGGDTVYRLVPPSGEALGPPGRRHAGRPHRLERAEPLLGPRADLGDGAQAEVLGHRPRPRVAVLLDTAHEVPERLLEGLVGGWEDPHARAVPVELGVEFVGPRPIQPDRRGVEARELLEALADLLVGSAVGAQVRHEHAARPHRADDLGHQRPPVRDQVEHPP
jgi:streptogramin lyase